MTYAPADLVKSEIESVQIQQSEEDPINKQLDGEASKQLINNQ
jgi:hypothetical protein